MAAGSVVPFLQVAPFGLANGDFDRLSLNARVFAAPPGAIVGRVPALEILVTASVEARPAMLDPNEIERLKATLARPASIAEFCDTAPHDDLASSWFGRVNVGLPNETWPHYLDRPMIPIAQLNLREAPYVPPGLADIALITVFLDREELRIDNPPNGQGWLVRAYSRIEDLQTMPAPPEVYKTVPTWQGAGDEALRSCSLRFRLLEGDYPAREDVPDELSISDALDEAWEDHFSPAEGLKLGGWPFLLQGEVFWAPFNEHPANPEYVFQIDSWYEANFFVGDRGACYFGRGTGDARDTWTFDWSCL